MSPKRVQMQRTKGWRMPEGCVYVGRPTKWGNPYRWQEYPDYGYDPDDVDELRRMATSDFEGLVTGRWERLDLDGRSEYPVERIGELRGKDLACWCPLEDEHGNRVPCHADVLLEIANRGDGQ